MLQRRFSSVCLNLKKFGINKPSVINHNLSYHELLNHEKRNIE